MERRAIAVSGIVQGVGFRPFIYGLASRLQLRGFVKNQAGGVLIEVEGESDVLDRFLEALTAEPPPLAHIDRLFWERQPPRGDAQFLIDQSSADAAQQVFVSPDVAVCEDCLTEIFDSEDRRYLYPFLNCTHCGPRLTIIQGAPYDRERTTMAGFPMCPACRKEYDDPANRRFHAQPTACAACGPRLELVGPEGQQVPTEDPVRSFAAALLAGKIGALKGLGGYHLSCDTRREAIVAELRRRKHREEKPFAVMVADLAAVEGLCETSPAEGQLLLSPRRPIVLLRKRPASGIAESVAPGNPYLGVMLPYTPLHHLLLRAVGGVPLVMTSGNRSDEPIAYEDDDALQRLGGIADLFLMHNRPIHVRCDDSVTRIVDAQELPLRRSRGYAPQPIRLPFDCPRPLLAVGGQFKGTFALGSGRHAFLSHHLGDLDHYDAYRAFEKDVALYEQLFAAKPAAIVHDLHPDYASTRYARQRAADGVECLPVQHHHAHIAACMAENGLVEPVIGVAFDGTGFGLDGAIWGGEFLIGDYRGFRRAAHLRYVGMAGGDQAIRQPWRMAAAHLLDAGEDLDLLRARVPSGMLRTVRTMLERQLHTPLTSSMGRLFDAVAALAGVRDQVSYEGQAAIELEWLATGLPPDGGYPFALAEGATKDREQPLVVDTRPLIRAIAADARQGFPAARIARRFHATVVDMIGMVCACIRADTQLDAVVFSGGVFMNALLLHESSAHLTNAGFRVYRHRLTPPNDGGLSLGQLAVAAHSAAFLSDPSQP
jgi:hydrogenase maturation protein HypF